MKKTLAAVLAAMMALSTATVALAKDSDVDGDITASTGTEVLDLTEVNLVEYGTKPKYVLEVNGFKDWLGAGLRDGNIKIDVTVIEGRSLLAAAPTVKVYKEADGMDYAVMGLNIKHTYNTDLLADKIADEKTDFAVRIRVTALKNLEGTSSPLTDKDGNLLKKGDTLSVDEIAFGAHYNEILAYGKDMTITADEVKTNNVVVDASDLVKKLDEKDTETATFYFGDTAAFTAKISEAQKDVNIFYETKIADEYYDEYPEFDFEAIQFKGNVKFLRKGTLTFNAIGDEDTVVYEVTSDGLVELEIAEYDSTYDVVTVEGINTLTSYLVASEALEVEAEVEVEEPAVEEENPNTGAC